MKRLQRTLKYSVLPVAILLLSLATPSRALPKKIAVAATIPELGSLIRSIGGKFVEVKVFAQGQEDPHFVEAKPSFIRILSRADLFAKAGLDLEIGWVPVLLRNARNAKILRGSPGYLDASTVIHPLQVPTRTVDRSMGDVHPYGNPHYFLDPLNGLKVAGLIERRLSRLSPEHKSYFKKNYNRFRTEIGIALVGPKLMQKYHAFEKLALLYQYGRLGSFLKKRKQDGFLGGWLGLMAPYRGSKLVAEHNMWPYFARRFGLKVVAYLEPKPGVSPTTRHLQKLLELMKREHIKTILGLPYYSPRYSKFLAKKSGAQIVPMAHQVGSRKGTENYIKMIDYNVRILAKALGENR